MSKRSIKPEWTSGAHNIFWKEFKFLFNYKCNLLRSCYNISSDSKPRSACVKQAYSRVSEQGPLFYSLPFPEIDHIPKYRVYWIVSCGLQSFFFIISCALQSRAAYIFFFCLSKGVVDAQPFLVQVLLTKPLFALSSLFSASRAHVLAGSHEGLWWTEARCSGQATLPVLLIKR